MGICDGCGKKIKFLLRYQVYNEKDKFYVTYCDGIGCNASTKGALNLLKLGFKVKELIGGLDWWKRDGYKTNGKMATAGKEIICGC